MGEPFFFLPFPFSLFFFERRSVLFIWCDKIIKNVVFKSFCWLQLSIEGISFVPGPSTLLTGVCVCVFVRVYSTCCVFVQSCVLSSSIQSPWLDTWKQHMHSVFPFWSKQASLVTARTPEPRRALLPLTARDLTKARKLADQNKKREGTVCLCVFLLLSIYVCVCVLRIFLYPIQEEAEFCVTLVYWKQKWPLKQQHFSRWHWLWGK